MVDGRSLDDYLVSELLFLGFRPGTLFLGYFLDLDGNFPGFFLDELLLRIFFPDQLVFFPAYLGSWIGLPLLALLAEKFHQCP